MHPDEIREKLEGSLGQDKDIAALYLFGSRTGGYSTPMSGFDLAVLLKEPYDRKKYSGYPPGLHSPCIRMMSIYWRLIPRRFSSPTGY